MNIGFACLLFVLSGFYSVLACAGGLAQADAKPYTRNIVEYAIPDVVMLDRSGQSTGLREAIDYGGPVMVQFIFVTCSTVCPMLSYSFSAAQSELDTLSGGVYRLISISIDPEEDRPEKLNEYAARFKAGNNWRFLTGKPADVGKILKAFDASYAGNNKMYHKPLTFMRRNAGDNWIRIEGLLGKKDMIEEYKNMFAPVAPTN